MRSLGKALTLMLVVIFLTYLVMLQPATVKAQPKTITVPDDYPTIQSAIDHANAGDTVFVKAGEYIVSGFGLTIDRSISLMGENKTEYNHQTIAVEI